MCRELLFPVCGVNIGFKEMGRLIEYQWKWEMGRLIEYQLGNVLTILSALKKGTIYSIQGHPVSIQLSNLPNLYIKLITKNNYHGESFTHFIKGYIVHWFLYSFKHAPDVMSY